MKLSILISTINEGIWNIADILLDKRKDVEYVISHQYTEERFKVKPDALNRSDVILTQISGKGLSKSRNNAIKKATGDIGLLADDDVRYKHEYFDRVIKTFQTKTVDVCCFKIQTPTGNQEYKHYPSEKKPIKNLKGYYPSSIEIALSIPKVKKRDILFDHRFGLGAKFIGGEEKIFLHDCINTNMGVFFIPEYVVQHPYESSNKGIKDSKDQIKKEAAVNVCINGFLNEMKVLVNIFSRFTSRSIFSKQHIKAVLYRFSAITYILFTNKR